MTSIHPAAGIRCVERHRDGILIQFTDGRCAFYPIALLHAVLPQAELQDEERQAW